MAVAEIRPDWTVGTLTLVGGSKDFTTTGSALETAAIQAGDEIITQSGLTLIIATITEQNSGTLMEDCPAGAAGVDQPLRIRFQPDGSRYNGATADLVQRLSNGNLYEFAGLSKENNQFIVMGASGDVSKKPISDITDAINSNENAISQKFTFPSGGNAAQLIDGTGALTAKEDLPISTATQSALDLKASTMLAGTKSSYNWIINGNFTINQRQASSKAQPVGTYGYDRWKGHANGLEQIVEALPAGEYTLTWTGGGTGTFGTTTKTSPIKATVGAGNTSVIVPANATKVSLVIGDATGADPWVNVERPRSIEDTLCWRYFFRVNGWNGGHPIKYGDAGNTRNAGPVVLPNMRVAPTARILSQPYYLNCSDLSFGSAQRSDYAYLVVNVTALGSYRAWGGSFDFDAEFA